MVESGTRAGTPSGGRPAAVDRADPRTWRGIFVIPQTPFDESGELALDDLSRLIDFCVESGAHGIVYPVMASEFFVLSDAEAKKRPVGKVASRPERNQSFTFCP
jgi:hypothetical protein